MQHTSLMEQNMETQKDKRVLLCHSFLRAHDRKKEPLICFFKRKPKIAFNIGNICWRPHPQVISICFSVLSVLIFSHLVSPQCVTVIWRVLASSRRRASTSVRQTISVCTVHAATAVTASSQERWSLLWDARTTPSALSAASAGKHTHSQTHNRLLCIRRYNITLCLGNNTATLWI